jgi:GDP-D-mannose 3',5'-epimerase
MRTSTHPRVLVTGAGGFIGHHLVTALKQRGYRVRGVDIATIEAARMNGASRYLFSSSDCVYPEHLQAEVDVTPLKEEDGYPANPQDAYGWEKLVSERLCLCRKVAAVEPGGEIQVWGDGEQTRSFCRVDGPQGVRGRSSDNRRLREVLGWEPSVTLHQGLEPTYRWIEKQVTSRRPPWSAAGR